MLALTILGNNSAIPAYGRNPTAQILQTTEDFFLIDCGEGTQLQMTKYKVRKSKISHIYISHLHGDHYFGLIGLLMSMGLLGRTHDIHLHAPKELKDILDLQFGITKAELSYNIHFHPLGNNQKITDTERIEVFSFKVKHGIDCWGFLFREKRNPRKLDLERAISYGVPSSFYESLQKGLDYKTKKGTIVPNEEVTLAAPKPRSYAFCADTIYDPDLCSIVEGVDLLYHETTYLKDQEQRAASRFHSTTHQAGSIAAQAGVSKLLIGHYSSKYESLEPFLSETREVFANTELSVEGACIKI